MAGGQAAYSTDRQAGATYLHLVCPAHVSHPLPQGLASFWHLPLLLGARPAWQA